VLNEQVHDALLSNEQKQVLITCHALALGVDKLSESNNRSSGKRGKRSMKSRTQRFLAFLLLTMRETSMVRPIIVAHEIAC
jgi:hypothetical protein